MLVLAALALGAVVGAILGAVGGSFYLVLVIPALAGLAGGIGTAWLLGPLRLPSPLLATVAASLSAVAGTAAILIVMHSLARAAFVGEKGRTLGEAALAAHVEAWDRELCGGGGLLAPLRYRLTAGVTIAGSAPIDLGPAGNGALLAVEVLAAAAVAARVARRRASLPYCTPCDTWCARRVIGSAPAGSHTSILASLQEGQFHRVGRRLSDPEAAQPVMLHGWLCDRCERGDVRLELEVSDGGGRPEVVRSMDVRHEDLDAILESRDLKQA